ncbi:uncharacterized protein BO97DRAFT_410171 [Aspergillus homomorphus CBS 101889]|uniref:Phosphoglycerate mutase-like protein n=1 Tax=Aspergillus homomorphus (strain CBS 101889) TaxID=1450537 RepID=A0A395IC60_ASPHC|nr:hypothetical protein BO97DRAFT_410171 [Aspergillus homomorphus CBS 101889]RAL17787.1 hypothetical protein BO97DRAFT_410171 [Aspergillus homomorphus CBS 101889]
MPTTTHCIRHAEGEHNLEPQDHTLVDPKLTPKGQAQCFALRDSGFINHKETSLVTASLMFCTLEIAHLVFGPALQPEKQPGSETSSRNKTTCNPQILALPDTQEV